MTAQKLYYATNRNHIGPDPSHPKAYGTKFSDDGMENLRFGVVTVDADDSKIEKFVRAKMKDCGSGDGEDLRDYLTQCAETAQIDAYVEAIDPAIADAAQKRAKLGSKAMFDDVATEMRDSSDVLIYIHGFNVSWHDAVGSALALPDLAGRGRNRRPIYCVRESIIETTGMRESGACALPSSYKFDTRTEFSIGGHESRVDQ